MRALPFLLTATLVIAGCDDLSDTVTDRYATLADARADDLFDRGWLPDILPASARDIRTSNDLDLNISTGEFSFSPAEGPQMYRFLTPGAPTQSKLADWPDTVADYNQRGFSAWSYQKDKFKWVFFCSPAKGKCEYFLW